MLAVEETAIILRLQKIIFITIYQIWSFMPLNNNITIVTDQIFLDWFLSVAALHIQYQCIKTFDWHIM